MFSGKIKSFNLREIGIMKPVGSPGSSLTAIGVGLYVAFGGVLFGYTYLSF
jgi:SP family sugar:H+ symporter-like MFS transporter